MSRDNRKLSGSQVYALFKWISISTDGLAHKPQSLITSADDNNSTSPLVSLSKHRFRNYSLGWVELPETTLPLYVNAIGSLDAFQFIRMFRAWKQLSMNYASLKDFSQYQAKKRGFLCLKRKCKLNIQHSRLHDTISKHVRFKQLTSSFDQWITFNQRSSYLVRCSNHVEDLLKVRFFNKWKRSSDLASRSLEERIATIQRRKLFRYWKKIVRYRAIARSISPPIMKCHRRLALRRSIAIWSLWNNLSKTAIIIQRHWKGFYTRNVLAKLDSQVGEAVRHIRWFRLTVSIAAKFRRRKLCIRVMNRWTAMLRHIIQGRAVISSKYLRNRYFRKLRKISLKRNGLRHELVVSDDLASKTGKLRGLRAFVLFGWLGQRMRVACKCMNIWKKKAYLSRLRGHVLWKKAAGYCSSIAFKHYLRRCFLRIVSWKKSVSATNRRNACFESIRKNKRISQNNGIDREISLRRSLLKWKHLCLRDSLQMKALLLFNKRSRRRKLKNAFMNIYFKSTTKRSLSKTLDYELKMKRKRALRRAIYLWHESVNLLRRKRRRALRKSLKLTKRIRQLCDLVFYTLKRNVKLNQARRAKPLKIKFERSASVKSKKFYHDPVSSALHALESMERIRTWRLRKSLRKLHIFSRNAMRRMKLTLLCRVHRARVRAETAMNIWKQHWKYFKRIHRILIRLQALPSLKAWHKLLVYKTTIAKRLYRFRLLRTARLCSLVLSEWIRVARALAAERNKINEVKVLSRKYFLKRRIVAWINAFGVSRDETKSRLIHKIVFKRLCGVAFKRWVSLWRKKLLFNMRLLQRVFDTWAQNVEDNLVEKRSLHAAIRYSRRKKLPIALNELRHYSRQSMIRRWYTALAENFRKTSLMSRAVLILRRSAKAKALLRVIIQRKNQGLKKSSASYRPHRIIEALRLKSALARLRRVTDEAKTRFRVIKKRSVFITWQKYTQANYAKLSRLLSLVQIIRTKRIWKRIVQIIKIKRQVRSVRKKNLRAVKKRCFKEWKAVLSAKRYRKRNVCLRILVSVRERMRMALLFWRVSVLSPAGSLKRRMGLRPVWDRWMIITAARKFHRRGVLSTHFLAWREAAITRKLSAACLTRRRELMWRILARYYKSVFKQQQRAFRRWCDITKEVGMKYKLTSTVKSALHESKWQISSRTRTAQLTASDVHSFSQYRRRATSGGVEAMRDARRSSESPLIMKSRRDINVFSPMLSGDRRPLVISDLQR